MASPCPTGGLGNTDVEETDGILKQFPDQNKTNKKRAKKGLHNISSATMAEREQLALAMRCCRLPRHAAAMAPDANANANWLVDQLVKLHLAAGVLEAGWLAMDNRVHHFYSPVDPICRISRFVAVSSRASQPGAPQQRVAKPSSPVGRQASLCLATQLSTLPLPLT